MILRLWAPWNCTLNLCVLSTWPLSRKGFIDVSVKAGAFRSTECLISVVSSWLVAVMEWTSPSSNLEMVWMKALIKWLGYDLEDGLE